MCPGSLQTSDLWRPRPREGRRGLQLPKRRESLVQPTGRGAPKTCSEALRKGSPPLCHTMDLHPMLQSREPIRRLDQEFPGPHSLALPCKLHLSSQAGPGAGIGSREGIV